MHQNIYITYFRLSTICRWQTVLQYWTLLSFWQNENLKLDWVHTYQGRKVGRVFRIK